MILREKDKDEFNNKKMEAMNNNLKSKIKNVRR